MQCLIDADVLRYEIGSCGEYNDYDEATGETVKVVRDFEFVQELFDSRVRGIIQDTDSDEPPILFLTGDTLSERILNRASTFTDQPKFKLETPLRQLIAVSKPYKGTRKEEKPFHFHNLTAYILSNYDTRVSNGLEADDLICIEQFRRNKLRVNDTVICTRDKDLRQCPGWHFGWECGKQPSFGPILVDARGWIKISKNGELKGVGTKFFFAQMLMGDNVDNIPGCKGIGPIKAYKMLKDCNTKKEFEKVVIQAYKDVYKENYKQMLEEQSKLLWMIRELNEDGSPKHYEWNLDD